MLRLIEAIIQRIKWGPKREFPVWREVTFDPEQLRRYTGHPFIINNFAWSLLTSVGGLHSRPTPYRLVKVSLDDLGQSKKLINNKKLLECARYHGLLPCPPQLAVAIGYAVAAEEGTYLTLATEPLFFKGRGTRSDYGHYLAFKQQNDKVCLMISPDKGPTMSWFSDADHIFVLPFA